MEEKTKNKLEKAGKIFLGIAELATDSMRQQAVSYSKNKNIPEEYREKYAETAEGFLNLKNSIHEYKERIGKSKTEELELEETEEFADYESIELQNDSSEFEQNTQKTSKCYDDYSKAIKQKNSSIMANSESEINIENWSSKWVSLGCLKDFDYTNCKCNGVGIIRFIYNKDIVYVVRAIELNKGGISNKIEQFKLLKINKKSKAYNNISKNIDAIYVDAINVGKSTDAIDISRKLEVLFIKEYNPKWM